MIYVGNRKILYGYKMVKGEIVPNKSEQNIVQSIFTQYASGVSYGKIATKLTQQGSIYHENKSIWNKNMVARILQNVRYLGDDDYPPVLEENLFQSVVNARKNKEKEMVVTKTKTNPPLNQKQTITLEEKDTLEHELKLLQETVKDFRSNKRKCSEILFTMAQIKYKLLEFRESEESEWKDK